MTPQELHAAIDAARRARGLVWWQVAVQLDVGVRTLNRLRHGEHSQAVNVRGPAWLAREGGAGLGRQAATLTGRLGEAPSEGVGR